MKWAQPTWETLHRLSFFIDEHENDNPDAQRQFHYMLGTLRYTMPCTHCRKHLTAHLEKTPPPEPEVYESSTYTNARYIFDLHNQVNERQHKIKPTFDEVKDFYVNGNEGALCPPSFETPRCEYPKLPQVAKPLIIGASVLLILMIIGVALLQFFKKR
ncbi:Erv1/Alr family FAD-linked sulfhydryl oxidase [bacterium]|nr:Erv1/Alr family FAD-linked sulfhydryl oxidase [bacterium]